MTNIVVKVKFYSGRKADIWALGITVYALTYLKLPFWSDTEIEIYEKIMSQDIVFHSFRNVSDGTHKSSLLPYTSSFVNSILKFFFRSETCNFSYAREKPRYQDKS